MANTGINFVTVRIDDSKCTRCMECVECCPTSALTYESPVTFVHNAYECSYDELCMDVCPEQCIEILEM